MKPPVPHREHSSTRYYEHPRDQRLLHGMRPVAAQPFDGGNLGTIHQLNGGGAGTGRLAIHVHSTGATQAGATTKLGALQAQFIPDDPQKGRIRFYIYRVPVSIHCQAERHEPFL